MKNYKNYFDELDIKDVKFAVIDADKFLLSKDNVFYVFEKYENNKFYNIWKATTDYQTYLSYKYTSYISEISKITTNVDKLMRDLVLSKNNNDKIIIREKINKLLDNLSVYSNNIIIYQ